MKKMLKKVIAFALALVLAASSFSGFAPKAVKAADDAEEYDIFLAFGGGSTADGWDLCWAGGAANDNIDSSKGSAKIKAGETVTLELDFKQAVAKTWYFAPAVVAKNIVNAEFEVKVYYDGKEAAVDSTIGKNWWYEGTGDYDAETTLRVYGGYNEWGDKFSTPVENLKNLKVEVTCKKLEVAPSYDIFLAFGGGSTADGWDLCWAGGAANENIDSSKASAKIRAGETKTLELDFKQPVAKTWYFAPAVVAKGIADAEFEVKVYYDGKEATVDSTIGKNWWYEGTGDFDANTTIRVYGGYNEWGDKFNTPVENFTNLKVEVTCKKLATVPTYEMVMGVGAGSKKDGYDIWEKSEKVTFKAGDTVTIEKEFETAPYEFYYYVPAILGADGIKNLSYTIISYKENDVEMVDKLNLAPTEDSKAWWYEGLDEETNTIRLMGGYNAWSADVTSITPSEGTKKISYTIKVDTISTEAIVDYTGEFEAFLAIGGDNGDGGWGLSSAGAPVTNGIETSNVTAKVGEQFELTLKMPETAVNLYYVAPVILLEQVQELTFTLDEVKVNGVDVTATTNTEKREKGNWWYEGTGDFKDTVAIRLNAGYNQWAEDAQALAEQPNNLNEISYKITVTSIKTGVKEEAEGPIVVEYSGSYNAYLQVQTDTDYWIFRNSWEDAEYGKDSAYFTKLHSTKDLTVDYSSDFTDAVVDGNGTYTVKLENADFLEETHFSIIGVSTDIPYSDALTVSDVSVKVNGKELYTWKEGVVVYKDSKGGYASIMCQNNWNNDVKDLISPNFPVSTVEVVFTIGGLGYDSASGGSTVSPEPTKAPTEAAATPTTAPTAAPTTAPADAQSGSNVGLIIGIIVALAVVAGAVVYFVKKKK